MVLHPPGDLRVGTAGFPGKRMCGLPPALEMSISLSPPRQRPLPRPRGQPRSERGAGGAASLWPQALTLSAPLSRLHPAGGRRTAMGKGGGAGPGAGRRCLLASSGSPRPGPPPAREKPQSAAAAAIPTAIANLQTARHFRILARAWKSRKRAASGACLRRHLAGSGAPARLLYNFPSPL